MERCSVCERQEETRLGVCFDCASFESLILTKVDMWEEPVKRTLQKHSESMNILRAILEAYSVVTTPQLIGDSINQESVCFHLGTAPEKKGE